MEESIRLFRFDTPKNVVGGREIEMNWHPKKKTQWFRNCQILLINDRDAQPPPNQTHVTYSWPLIFQIEAVWLVELFIQTLSGMIPDPLAMCFMIGINMINLKDRLINIKVIS